MVWRVEVRKVTTDPEERSVEADAHDLGLRGIAPIRLTRVYYLEGELTREQVEMAAAELFCDPVCESYRILEGGVGRTGIEVAYNLGVTDPSVESIERALADLGLPCCRVRTSRAYETGRVLTEGERELLTFGVLMNPVVQHVARPGEDIFGHAGRCRFRRRYVRLRYSSARDLERISQKGLLALSVAEMQAIQRYFRRIGRDPTDVELETFAQTWSEHCQHKTFRGRLVIGGRVIDNILKETIFRVQEELRCPWVLSAFHDNSGVIEFDDHYAVTFKVETHNHPSALEPYGGAATGVGGVVRDCLGTGLGAKPILNTDVFCVGYVTKRTDDVPQGVLHPRRVLKGIVAGVRDYGNRMGIPTANGAVCFDDGFLGNPLVFCGTLGLIPKDKVTKRVRKGQAIVLLGGSTGRDGVHGVTFASLELGQSRSEAGSVVQIGNPIEEKRLQDLVLEARDRGLFSAITDCGGGGLSSAVGELTARCGCEVWLEKVPLKYQGLSPAEIWISEAQERMVVLSEPDVVGELLELARVHDVRATVIGCVTDTRRLRVYYRGRMVVDVSMRFLHHRWRVTERTGCWCRPDVPEPFVRPAQDLSAVLLKLLASPNIASKEWISRQYDHEVQAGSVMKPLAGWSGDGPTDACVVMPVLGSRKACVVACGIRPRLGLIDPYWMAASAIDEALRNCVAAGGDIDRTALLDNFSWGSPERPEQLGGLVRAAEACYEVARTYRAPFISGKDSLYNEFRTAEGESLPIPPTLLVSAVSIIADVSRTLTPEFRQPDSLVYVVGETFDELGGSEYLRLNQGLGRAVPRVDARRGRRLMRSVGNVIRSGLVTACHDVSDGGLGVALAEMAIASGLGVQVTLRRVPGARRFRRDDFLLFSESNTRFVCEVPLACRSAFEHKMSGVVHAVVGRTTRDPRLRVTGLTGRQVVCLDVAAARRAWKEGLAVLSRLS